MWTATITEKNLSNGVLTVHVSYQKGTDQFTEVYGIERGDQLGNQVRFKLELLERLDTFADTLVKGPFTPPPPPMPPVERLNLQKLVELKQLVDLGVKSEKDTEYLDALSAVKLDIEK